MNRDRLARRPPAANSARPPTRSHQRPRRVDQLLRGCLAAV